VTDVTVDREDEQTSVDIDVDAPARIEAVEETGDTAHA